MNYPVLKARDDGKYELTEPYIVVTAGKDGVYFEVPAGFVTDGASIPRFLWRLCGHPMETPRICAAVAHDYMYSVGEPTWTRAEADATYRDILKAVGVSAWRANVEYYALRIFGGSHFSNQTKETK